MYVTAETRSEGVNELWISKSTMLSATSEYALRALTQLAQLAGGQVMLGRELAERTVIPPHYLPKIMLSLRNAGLIMATRGTGGGYTLLRPPDAIHLIDVVSLFEGPSNWPHCLLRPHSDCSDENPCSAHRYWGDVRRGYLEFLEQTTLKDISNHAPHLTEVKRAALRRGEES
jgi:Rrf2 family protein